MYKTKNAENLNFKKMKQLQMKKSNQKTLEDWWDCKGSQNLSEARPYSQWHNPNHSKQPQRQLFKDKCEVKRKKKKNNNILSIHKVIHNFRGNKKLII